MGKKELIEQLMFGAAMIAQDVDGYAEGVKLKVSEKLLQHIRDRIADTAEWIVKIANAK